MARLPPRVPLAPALPPDARARVAAELQSGERLLWEGQPVPGLYARRGCGTAVFGLFFAGFAAFWISMAGGFALPFIGSDSAGFGIVGVLFPLFGLPFLGVGLWLVAAPVWMRREAARTVYAVTDRRAIVFRGKPFGTIEVRSFGPAALTEVVRNERLDGAGDLVFRQDVTITDHHRGRSSVSRTQVGFIAVDRVREVDALIQAHVVEPYLRAAGPAAPEA